MNPTQLLRKTKTLLFRGAEATGINRVVAASGLRRRRLLILCYHGVSLRDEHEWNPELYVSPEHLYRRMQLVRDSGCTVLPLGDALDRCAKGTLPRRAIALTFDDGAADFALRGVPILEEFGFPATVYLTTYYCGRPVPVPNVAISYLLWKARDRGTIDGRGLVEPGRDLAIATAADRAASAAALVATMTTMAPAAKDTLVRDVAIRCGIDPDEFIRSRLFQIMTPEEVRSLPRDRVNVELHTHRHRTPQDAALFTAELRDNRDAIAELGGTSGTHFCYPSGDYRADMLPLLRAQGIRSATTCVPGFVLPTTDPLLAPRFIDTMGVSESVFRGWLSGFAALIPRRASR